MNLDSREHDAVGEALVAAGLVPNALLLDLNGSLEVPDDMAAALCDHPEWGLPTRLMQFPVCVSHERFGFPRKVWWRHSLMKDHPFGERITQLSGVTVDILGPPEMARQFDQGVWWHAADLGSEGRWSDLLATRRFTEDDCIARAVWFCLQHESGGARLDEAYRVLAALGSHEPSTSRDDVLGILMAPSPVEGRYPVNTILTRSRDPYRPTDAAWCLIVAIERGLVEYDHKGYLQWTGAGLAWWRDKAPAGESEAASSQRSDVSGTAYQGALAF